MICQFEQNLNGKGKKGRKMHITFSEKGAAIKSSNRNNVPRTSDYEYLIFLKIESSFQQNIKFLARSDTDCT